MKMNKRKGAVLLLMCSLLLSAGVMGCGAPDEPVQQETGAQAENGLNTEKPKNAGTKDASAGQSEGTKDTSAEQSKETKDTPTEQSKETDNAPAEKYSVTTGDPDVESLFHTADINGELVEISDGELRVAPAQFIDENTMVQAADGEAAENIVYVAVSDHTVFQIMRIDRASLSLIEIKDTDKNGMTKESSVLVYGSKQDETHWSADKTILVKWE